ncbi:MAG: peptidase [Gammaproteobacteria bacterium]|nr:MAG: peptidase [Gammaproteobacteria bacterium]
MFQMQLLQQFNNRVKQNIRSLIAVATLGICAPTVHAAEVDLLVLYDSHTSSYFNQQVETAMQNWVTQINNVYVDSQIDLKLRLVGVVAHEEDGSDMEGVLDNLRQDSAAISLRTKYGADFVTQLHKTGSCGIAYFTVNREWAWGVVGPDCGPLTMAHELGHNMGLAHSRRQGDTTGSRYAYGLGHGVDGLFGTVMTYAWLYTNRSNGRIARFSNPNISCLGVPCGVPVGQSDQAYAALAINNVKNELAAFRSAVSQSSASNISSSRSSSVISSTPRSSSLAVSSGRSSLSSSRISSSSLTVSSSSRSLLSSSRSSQSSSQRSSIASELAQCEYRILNQGNTSFSADVRITNISNQPINGWAVSWGYQRSVWLAYASGARVTGRNPYTATNSSVINPGQTASVTLWGYKGRGEQLEVPVVGGSICR